MFSNGKTASLTRAGEFSPKSTVAAAEESTCRRPLTTGFRKNSRYPSSATARSVAAAAALLQVAKRQVDPGLIPASLTSAPESSTFLRLIRSASNSRAD